MYECQRENMINKKRDFILDLQWVTTTRYHTSTKDSHKESLKCPSNLHELIIFIKYAYAQNSLRNLTFDKLCFMFTNLSAAENHHKEERYLLIV